jgi:hypothetical protein
LKAIALRGFSRLAADGVTGVSHVVEAMQDAILERLPLPGRIAPRAVGGIAGLVHRSVRGIARGVGGGIDRLVERAAPIHWHGDGSASERQLRAIANGVLGDHLAASGNPLALPMRLWIDGVAVDRDPQALTTQLANAAPRLLLLAHGLCMSPSQWRRGDHDHGEAIALAHGYTPVYLEYNSGLRVAHNGRALATLLQQLADAWPVPLEGIAILGHSMGGLVARSAIHQATRAGLAWPRRLRDLVFLGTPHFGAPLERIGHGVDRLLLATPWSAPLAMLGRTRSAGITDLRHGALLDSHGPEGGDPAHDPVPLPRGVRCRTVAASLHEPRTARAQRWIGDGLVPLDSALGRHPDPVLALRFPRDSQLVVDDAGHFDLLADPRVHQQLLDWLEPAPRTIRRARG